MNFKTVSTYSRTAFNRVILLQIFLIYAILNIRIIFLREYYGRLSIYTI